MILGEPVSALLQDQGQGGDSHWDLVVRKAKLDRSSNSNTQHLLNVYPSARHCSRHCI